MIKENKVSIIVPTLDSERDITILLMSMTRNNIDKRAEVIAVDAGSIDQTKIVLEHYKFPKIINVGRVSKGKARNEGIKAATGDIIINIDSDVDILPGWFEEILRTIDVTGILAGYSPAADGKHLPRVSTWVDGQDITYPTCNIAHKREVFDKVGFFNETQNLPEDCEFNYRCVKAGYTIFYNPQMKLYHNQRHTTKGFVKQAYWNGEARYEINKLHPDIKHNHQHGVNARNMARLGFGFLGFMIGRYAKAKGEKI